MTDQWIESPMDELARLIGDIVRWKGDYLLVFPWNDYIRVDRMPSGRFALTTGHRSVARDTSVDGRVLRDLTWRETQWLAVQFAQDCYLREPLELDRGCPNPQERLVLDAIANIADVLGWTVERADGRGLAFGLGLYAPGQDEWYGIGTPTEVGVVTDPWHLAAYDADGDQHTLPDPPTNALAMIQRVLPLLEAKKVVMPG